MKPSFSRFLARVVNSEGVKRHDFLKRQYEAAALSGHLSNELREIAEAALREERDIRRRAHPLKSALARTRDRP